MRRLLLRSWIAALLLGPITAARAEGPTRSDLLATDPTDAFKSIEKAGASKDPAYAGTLLEVGIETTHPFLAVACGDALAAIGPKAAETVEYQRVLAKVLRVREPKPLTNLARVLGAYGDASVDDTMAFLCVGRHSVELMTEALFMAGSLPVSKDRPFYKTVAAVGSALRSKQPEVVVAACSAARRIKDPTYVELLGPIARRSQEKYPGLYAVAALSAMGVRSGIGPYLHVLDGDIKPETRNAALKAVTDLSGPDDAEDLLGLMRATKKDYREAACIAFGLMAARGQMFGPKAPVTTTSQAVVDKVFERLLQIVSEDGDWEVRDAADRTLQRIGEPVRAIVEAKIPALVGTFDRDTNLTAIELAGFFGVKSTYRDLVKTAVFEKDPALRMYAARAVSLVDPDAAIDEWKEATQKDHKGRAETLSALRAMGYVRTEKAYTTLLGYFGGKEKEWSEEIQAEVERSLERITAHRFGRRTDRWTAWYAKAKGKDPFHPHVARFDRTKNRREAVEKRLYGLTESTERSVESALQWLDRMQEPLGLWDGNAKNFQGIVACEPAYTGLSLLSFLGAGYSSSGGKYHETVRRGVEFLMATQFYDGGFPVTGGGDNSWIFAYLTGMAVWGMTEAYAITADEDQHWPAQRGCDYLVRTQTPGAGWRYSVRAVETDTSATSWVLMTLKSASMAGLHVPPKSMDGIDLWLEKACTDITGEEEVLEDLMSEYDKEVGGKRVFKAIAGYRELSVKSAEGVRSTTMTPLAMVCRFFMGWKRSHPYMIGAANFSVEALPAWRQSPKGLPEVNWYFYWYYYGTLAMHQMGGRYWRSWNERIKQVLPSHQRIDPEDVAGSWDPETRVFGGGRLFSTTLACMTLETYYRFSPLMLDTEEDVARKEEERRAAEAKAEAERKAREAAGMGEPAMGEPAMGEPSPPMDDGATPSMGG